MLVNGSEYKDLPLHGRGRWFDPSIAHSKNLSICRQNIKDKGRPRKRSGTFVQQPCNNAAG